MTVEESQENPTRDRERRNVLKLGHSLREGGKKCLCINVSTRPDLSVNCAYMRVRVRMYVCYTGQYAAAMQQFSKYNSISQKSGNMFLVIKRFKRSFSSFLWKQIPEKRSSGFLYTSLLVLTLCGAYLYLLTSKHRSSTLD